MFTASLDTPASYSTSVAKDRLPVFKTGRVKTIACAAVDEARRNGEFLIFACAIMPDHLRLITSSPLKVSETLRNVNWITGRRATSSLEEAGYSLPLRKLQRDIPS